MGQRSIQRCDYVPRNSDGPHNWTEQGMDSQSTTCPHLDFSSVILILDFDPQNWEKQISLIHQLCGTCLQQPQEANISFPCSGALQWTSKRSFLFSLRAETYLPSFWFWIGLSHLVKEQMSATSETRSEKVALGYALDSWNPSSGPAVLLCGSPAAIRGTLKSPAWLSAEHQADSQPQLAHHLGVFQPMSCYFS